MTYEYVSLDPMTHLFPALLRNLGFIVSNVAKLLV